MARKRPSFYARWCRKECGIDDVCRIDLEALARDRDIAVYPAPTDSFEGAAMIVDGLSAICLNEGQMPQRYRFTFAHELGHLFLPWHYDMLARGHQFVDKTVSWDTPAEGMEREANSFAAELLSPAHLVKPFLTRGALDTSKVITVADEFDVSKTSAALRIAEVTTEPVAVLLFRRGSLSWRFQSNEFPFGVPLSGLRPPAGSATAEAVDGGDGCVTAVEVDATGWFVDRRYGDIPTALESCIRLGNTGDVLTLLWSPE